MEFRFLGKCLEEEDNQMIDEIAGNHEYDVLFD